jgi:glycosyltransferase involved in cell wall biosynthesis
MLARELRLRGYRVGVMSAGGVFAPELQKGKVPFLKADISGFYPRDLLYLRRIQTLAREYNPDLIHITHQSLAELGGLIAGGLGVPYILTFQSPLKSKVRIHRDLFQEAIAVSQKVRQSAVNAGRLPREKVSVVEYGVETDVQPAPRRDGSLIPVVGTVCGLEREHGVKDFIRAARLLISRDVRAAFLIVGTGPYEKRIRQTIRKHSLERHVTLASTMPSYRNLVSPIDIFVSPTLSEGFNIFILQAMSRGLPVVASAAGGVFSLINDDETGLIVPKRDISLLAEKIQTYVHEKDYADRLGRNGFYFVQKNFPIHRMLDRTLGVYTGEVENVEEAEAAL